MEIIILIIIIIFFVGILAPKAKEDNREELLLGANGLPLALRRTSTDPSHEQFIHDGTPHRNPHVYTKIVTKWAFGLIPYAEDVEISEYPLGRNANLPEIQKRVAEARRQGYDVEIVEMDEGANRNQERRENGTQLDRGVTPNRLTHNARGKKRHRWF